MNNMAKNWKSILFYILIPVLLIGAVWYLSSNQSGTEVQYSQVVQMFEENQVKDFSLDLSSGALTYKTFKDPEKEQRYTVPNVSLFLDDVKDNVDAYNAKQTNNKNRITYNYKKGAHCYCGSWVLCVPADEQRHDERHQQDAGLWQDPRQDLGGGRKAQDHISGCGRL